MHSISFLCMLKRSLGLYPPHPLWNALPIAQLSSVPIREMLWLGRDRIMYPSVQIIPGVVDQRWIGIREAGQGVWHDQLANMFLAILQVCWHCLAGRENCFKHSDRFARHVCEVLHPHNIGLYETPELLCKLNEPCTKLRVAFFFLAWVYFIEMFLIIPSNKWFGCA